MSLTDYTNTVKGGLNRALINSLSTLLALIGFGDILRSMRTFLRGAVPGAAASNPYIVAAALPISLPDDAKASGLIKAYARAGTGTLGPLTVDAEGDSEPAAGHIGVTGSGDIATNHTDAFTKIDLEYHPEKGDVVEISMSASSADTFVIPTALKNRGVLRLLEAESLTGTLVSKMIVLIPADAKPATTKARLKLDKGTVQFAVADAVTSARLKLLVASAIDVNAVLEGASPTI